jgi:hypothetical protein
VRDVSLVCGSFDANHQQARTVLIQHLSHIDFKGQIAPDVMGGKAPIHPDVSVVVDRSEMQDGALPCPRGWA